jgi:hypothetical protein
MAPIETFSTLRPLVLPISLVLTLVHQWEERMRFRMLNDKDKSRENLEAIF